MRCFVSFPKKIFVKKIICPILFFLAFASCKTKNETPHSPRIPPKIKIVVIGSSTAEGVGASVPDSSWVNRYRRFLQKINPQNEVVNLAKGGYTTYHLLPSAFTSPEDRPSPDTIRNITTALAEKPSGIILNLPSNDSAKEWETGEQLAGFEKIIQPALREEIPIWVCTTQPRNFEKSEQIQSQYDVRDSIIVRYGDFVLDFWTAAADERGWIKKSVDSGDGIHINDLGHRLLFQEVREKVLPTVFVE